MIALAVALAVSETPPPPPELAQALALGDAYYAGRAEGSAGELALPDFADAAIAEYRRALALDPDSLEARAKLLRGLFFRSTFCGAADRVQRALYDEAKAVADLGLERLETRLGHPEGEPRIAALARLPSAAALYFWAGVSWGQWALKQSKLTAIRKGVAGRIRELAQTAIALDPELDQGSPHMLLGRLHDECPWIPFLTGWVSKRMALLNLRRALELGPVNSVNRYFLAIAILQHDDERRDEAERLLRLLIDTPPRNEFWVEDIHYQEMAKQRLRELD